MSLIILNGNVTSTNVQSGDILDNITDLTVSGDLNVEFINHPNSIELSVGGDDKITVQSFRTLHKQRFINQSAAIFETNNADYDDYDNNPFGFNVLFKHWSYDGDDDYRQMFSMEADLSDMTTDEDYSMANLYRVKNFDSDFMNLAETKANYDSTDRLNSFEVNVESQFDGLELLRSLVKGSVKQGQTQVPFKFMGIDSGSTLPASPDDGDVFLHDTGSDHVIKIWSVDYWANFQPESGSIVYDNTNNRLLIRVGSAWRSFDTTAI